MSVGLLSSRRLDSGGIRNGRIVIDERASIGGVFTTLLNPDGDGRNYRLGAWATVGANGRIAVLAPGQLQCLICGGCSSSYGGGLSWSFGGGHVVEARTWLPVGVQDVIVGAGGVYPGSTPAYPDVLSGSPSRIGTIIGARGGTCIMQGAGQAYGTAISEGRVSRITGQRVVYGAGYNAVEGIGGIGSAASYNVDGNPGVVLARWEI